MREIKESEIAEFLLNPFEKTASFGKTIIQKYSRNCGVDDFICTNLQKMYSLRAGFIVYENEKIVIERTDLFNEELVNSLPFTKLNDLKRNIKETIVFKADQLNADKIEEFQTSEKYIGVDTSSEILNICDYVEKQALDFTNSLDCDELALIASGGLDSIEKIVKNIVASVESLLEEIAKHKSKAAVDYSSDCLFDIGDCLYDIDFT